MSSGAYEPREVEPRLYRQWEDAGQFHAEPDAARPPFTIVIPPPNVTGALHLGHALNNTLQDMLIRRKRMQGFNACWLPGTDHAGIATQAVVERRLKEEQNLTRHDIGRDALVQKIWDWKEDYNSRILGQLRRMGCSCDWQRTRFTLDEQCAKAVYATFFRFFSDGLIYRGLRLVNWDAALQTAVADDEIEHKTVRTNLWHIRYPICGARESAATAIARAAAADAIVGRDYLSVATTRPETMLADTAVAVHPNDERYQALIGQAVLLPLMNRRIPVIGDGMLVKREFGTGCVKVTPGHDPNDHDCWRRKCGEPDEFAILDLLTPDGRINENGKAAAASAADGERADFSGMKKEDARKAVVAQLEQLGLLEKVEPYETEVGHSDRSKTPIEPLRSEQWFVRMSELAEVAMEAVRDGRVRFFPARYAKTYLDWLGEKRDWCISRQLWWGHRIPVWTRKMSWAEYESLAAQDVDALVLTAQKLENVSVRVTSPDGCSHCVSGIRGRAEYDEFHERLDADTLLDWQVCLDDPTEHPWIREKLEQRWGFVQDADVLDTWFSSALWPHSTFGWPQPTRELSYFYPTTVLSTAREIITLWVARMVLTGLYNLGRVPFQHVYIHPVIQDGQGRPMKKSLGNGVDPLDIIDAYGADALRYTLAQLCTETQDIRIPVKPAQSPDGRTVNTSERFELGRNFVTKLWQAATGFVIPTCRDVQIQRRATGLHTSRPVAQMPLFEKWIRIKLLACIREIDQRLDHYEFAPAMDALRTFFWNDLCSWYLEEVKSHIRESGADADEINDVRITLLQVFDLVLALAHPAIPFVTEEIWAQIGAAIPKHHELIWPADLPLPAEAPALIVAPWPRAESRTAEDCRWLAQVAAEQPAEREVDCFLTVIRALREIRTSLNAIRAASKQAALRTLPAAIVRADAATAALLTNGRATIARLAQVERDGLTISPTAGKPPQSLSRVLTGVEVYVPIGGLADLDVERKRLSKEQAELGGHLSRLEAKLGNDGFVAKAPLQVLEQERARVAELRDKLRTIETHLAELG